MGQVVSTIDARASRVSRHDGARSLLVDDATEVRRKAADEKGGWVGEQQQYSNRV
jgi:hypothetical protein